LPRGENPIDISDAEDEERENQQRYIRRQVYSQLIREEA
jgi:hypothetical protein